MKSWRRFWPLDRESIITWNVGGRCSAFIVYKFVPAHFIAERHLRETLSCPCGDYIVTAEGPSKWADKDAECQGH